MEAGDPLADWVGKVITSDLRMVITPNLYGKRKRPQWRRFACTLAASQTAS